MRPTIPKVIAPFHSPPSPALFRDFKAGIERSTGQIKSLRKNFQGPETQAVFRYARQRAAADGDLGKSGDVPQFGWIEREKKAKETVKKGTATATELKAALSDEEVKRIVQEWKGRNPILTIKEEGCRDLTVCHLQELCEAVLIRVDRSLLSLLVKS